MNYYFITGTSSGIGKALAELLLEDATNKVVGISRKCTIKNENYKHFFVDLSDTKSILAFEFEIENIQAPDKIVLINNAGTVGIVNHVGSMDSNDIVKSYTLNLIAPSVLINKFINTFQFQKNNKIILNVSSGAGKKPVDGWSVYCSTKSGLDMFSEVVNCEQKINSFEDILNFKIYSIAPGVVDTAMQQEIRKLKKESFSKIENFISLKANNQLLNPKYVAQKYIDVINNGLNPHLVVFPLSDLK